MGKYLSPRLFDQSSVPQLAIYTHRFEQVRAHLFSSRMLYFHMNKFAYCSVLCFAVVSTVLFLVRLPLIVSIIHSPSLSHEESHTASQEAC